LFFFVQAGARKYGKGDKDKKRGFRLREKRLLKTKILKDEN
jgi:hypothetical protein